MWHKVIKGRSPEDVASVFIHFIRKNRDIQSFIFWVDNFSAQNKNWFFSTALANEVDRRNTATHTITFKYFEPEHTLMSADSFHYRVEQEVQKKKLLEDFQDFVDIVDTCGQSIVINYQDFF